MGQLQGRDLSGPVWKPHMARRHSDLDDDRIQLRRLTMAAQQLAEADPAGWRSTASCPACQHAVE